MTSFVHGFRLKVVLFIYIKSELREKNSYFYSGLINSISLYFLRPSPLHQVPLFAKLFTIYCSQAVNIDFAKEMLGE